jgi:Flp pilus assembly protein CpaB
LAPPGALHRLPGRAVATVDLVPGEPLLARRIAPGGSSALAARLPNGTRGVAIPHDDTQLPVAKGDVVDVLATFDTGDGGPPTITVARRALVIDVGRAAVTVAVQPDEAPRVAFAVIGGAVSLVLSPAGS